MPEHLVGPLCLTIEFSVAIFLQNVVLSLLFVSCCASIRFNCILLSRYRLFVFLLCLYMVCLYLSCLYIVYLYLIVCMYIYGLFGSCRVSIWVVSIPVIYLYDF